MKLRRKRDLVSWNRFFWCTIAVSLSFVIFSTFTFSTLRFLGVSFRPVLISSWQNPALNAVTGEYSVNRRIFRPPEAEIQETVIFPDQVLIFLKYPSASTLFTKEDLQCGYFNRNSSRTEINLPPISIDGQDDPKIQIVRCPLQPRRLSVSLAWEGQDRHLMRAPPPRRWDSLVYEALIDGDNTTVVFVKGLNLRPEKLTDRSRFECVYGWDFRTSRFLLRSEVLSVAQEIVRCKTPLSLLKHPQKLTSIKVSVRAKGKGIFPSIARPGFRPGSGSDPIRARRKPHKMCVCTMLRNQARFLKEWVIYHRRIGVQRWFIYDNNSDDSIETVVESLAESDYNVTRHIWPWLKTQEAGFAHCALRARNSCEWIGFIDVDEFLHLPDPDLTLHDILRNYSGLPWVGELRTACHSFGPSGLQRVPSQGVMVGYTCRMVSPERHKSIVRPEALNSTLVNVVHHFHLKEGFDYVNIGRGAMVINHYKYQVWEVFKEKFYRRVATYVADWQEKENVGSKDRAPGLGTKAIEPPNWSGRFCEITDTGLRDWVLQSFMERGTGLLPWQEKPLTDTQHKQQ
ncbi:C3H4 type zinc finger protein (DUF23) [Tasmannia lanceolata]|uniref:C3H4 type zinc finger protein (DUF23) n=1 Tax=Tasmannia lanceolata TaxID=3420 RepID=UPI004062C78B